jgi:thermitase
MPVWLKASRALVTVTTIALTVCAFAQNEVSEQLLIKFRPKVSESRASAVLARVAAKQSHRIAGIDVRVVNLPAKANADEALARLLDDPDVQFAEKDCYYESTQAPTTVPNDPWFANWEANLKMTSCPGAWYYTTGSSSVVIAILDSGVDATHPDLVNKLVPGWNAYSNNADSSDVYGHGTKVAGIAGAQSNNGSGVASIAWNCPIMPIRVTDTSGNATGSAIDAGLVWAADHGAKIANLSFKLVPNAAMDSAFSYFRSHGGLVFTGSGNDGTATNLQNDPYLVTVGGTDGYDNIWSYSCYGNNIDVSAPMWGYSTIRGGGYGDVTGTSFASPLVAGEAALVFSANPSLTPSQVEAILENSADDKGAPGWDSYYGYGRINVQRAVTLALGTAPADSTPPIVSLTAPTSGSTVSGSIAVWADASDNNSLGSVTFYVDGLQAAQCLTVPYSFNWDTMKTANGTHTLKAVATDTANNSTAASITVNVSNADTVPPTISLVQPPVSSGSVSLSASASDNVAVANVTFEVDGIQVAQDSAPPYNCTWNAGAATNGSHTIVATATDTSGNTASASATVTVNNLDTTPPTVTLTAPAGGSGLLGTVSLTASASDNIGVASVSFYCDGALLSTTSSSPYSFNWDTVSVIDGAHTISAVATDAAGNSATASANVTVSNNATKSSGDTIAPTITITTPASGSKVGKSGLKVSVSASDNVGVVRVEYCIDGTLVATSTSSPFSVSIAAKSISTGSHILTSKAYDAAGNVGASQTINVVK